MLTHAYVCVYIYTHFSLQHCGTEEKQCLKAPPSPATTILCHFKEEEVPYLLLKEKLCAQTKIVGLKGPRDCHTE